ncbi:hypothetical protein GCWU000324_00859 [Kingella oralis ATCC 51147]|uniref:Uncharacterized protein n=1 Tax=Kingella oralis ATCC 51147 TaxID=629741 RepID=C4GFE2_9NEIS|nr:hypothetical protein GCWU000324_00859 [Kingella oralis ATCC 51147]
MARRQKSAFNRASLRETLSASRRRSIGCRLRPNSIFNILFRLPQQQKRQPETDH